MKGGSFKKKFLAAPLIHRDPDGYFYIWVENIRGNYNRPYRGTGPHVKNIQTKDGSVFTKMYVIGYPDRYSGIIIPLHKVKDIEEAGLGFLIDKTMLQVTVDDVSIETSLENSEGIYDSNLWIISSIRGRERELSRLLIAELKTREVDEEMLDGKTLDEHWTAETEGKALWELQALLAVTIDGVRPDAPGLSVAAQLNREIQQLKDFGKKLDGVQERISELLLKAEVQVGEKEKYVAELASLNELVPHGNLSEIATLKAEIAYLSAFWSPAEADAATPAAAAPAPVDLLNLFATQDPWSHLGSQAPAAKAKAEAWNQSRRAAAAAAAEAKAGLGPAAGPAADGSTVVFSTHHEPAPRSPQPSISEQMRRQYNKIAVEKYKKAQAAKAAAAAAPAPATGTPAELEPEVAAELQTKYSLVELQGDCPEGVAPGAKEESLNDADFEANFKMSREAFAALPKWKQQNLKKKFKIF